MNKLDKDYQELLKDILKNGSIKKDRTGTGTISVFGRQIRHKMSEGYSLLTTKKMAYKSMITELLWFLRGDTSIKYLVDNNCHIWDGDCYKRFNNCAIEIKEAYENGDILGEQKNIEDMFSDYNNLIILTKDEFINKIKTNADFCYEWGDLGKIYGFQWRKWSNYVPYQQIEKNIYIYREDKGIDQIQNLINDLKTNPDSRRLMVSAWNPSDLPNQILPPCHYGFQCYTREMTLKERSDYAGTNHYEVSLNIKIGTKLDDDEQLHKQLDDINIPRRYISLQWNQRSVDTFLGLPFNIASYGLLLEILAKIVNMIPDELIGNLGDTHLYLNHIDQANEQISRESFNLPKLKISENFLKNINKYNSDFEKFDFYDLINSLDVSDFIIEDYKSHSTIKASLSN